MFIAFNLVFMLQKLMNNNKTHGNACFRLRTSSIVNGIKKNSESAYKIRIRFYTN